MAREADEHRQRNQAHQEEAWRLRIDGWTQARIAAHLGISQQRVSQLLVVIEKRLHAEFAGQAEEIKARQTEQLQEVYREAVDQWRRSCEDAEKTTVISGRVKAGEFGVIDLPDLETVSREGQSGNPALLAQAMKALADIRQIWGLNAAEKQEISGPGGGPVRITEVVVELPRGESG